MASKEEKELDEKRKRKFVTFSLGNLKISKQYHGGPQPLGSSNMCLYLPYSHIIPLHGLFSASQFKFIKSFVIVVDGGIHIK